MDLSSIIPFLQLKFDAENLPSMQEHHHHYRPKYFGDVPHSTRHEESHLNKIGYHHSSLGDLSTSLPVDPTESISYYQYQYTNNTSASILNLGDNHAKEFLEGNEVVSLPTSQLSLSLDELPLRLPMWGIVILIIAYGSVFVGGVIGNCSVLFVVIRLKRLKNLVNLFILNLAVADLLVLIFCLLPNLVSNIFVPWVLGSYFCKGVAFIQGVSVCASIYSLLVISVERCISIQWPFKYLVTREKGKLIIILIWTFSVIVALPWAIFFQSGNFDEENSHLEFCIEVWPEEYAHWDRYYFLFGNLFICYLFPLTVILISYLTIWFRVYRRQIPSDINHTAMEIIHQKSKTAVLRMITVVVLIFALSWLPLYIIICRLKFGPEQMSDLESTIITWVYPVAQWMICCNSCMNAIIYSFLNRKFMLAFKNMFNEKCFKACKREKVRIKHKSPTVNILLKRFSTYRVETTVSNNNNNNNYDGDSSDTI